MNKLYKQVLKAIKKYDTIVVIRHDVPDFDASGSQFGLVTWIKDNYPEKKVYAVGKPHKFFSPSLYPITDSFDAENQKFLLIVVDCANQPRIDGKELIEKADHVIKIDHHPLCDHYGDVVIVDEHAEIVRRIFNLYVSGYGLKAIAKILNDDGIKSPGYYQKQLLGKNLGYTNLKIAKRF
jgi:phosphoesterase RecJ-like protein